MMGVERRKTKILARASLGNFGREVITHADFDRAKAVDAQNRTSTAEKRELKDNYLYVTRSEFQYRKAKAGRERESLEPYPPLPKKWSNRRKITETSRDAPGWFGVLDQPASKVPPEKSSTCNGTLTYLSRIQGWITVTPKHKDRSRPLEKAKIVSSRYRV